MDTQKNDIPVNINEPKKKKSIIDWFKNGHLISNGSKMIFCGIGLWVNWKYFMWNHHIMSLQEQQSLFLALGICMAVFLPIDISIIVQNAIQKKINNL